MQQVLSGERANLLRDRFQRLLESHLGIVFKVANTYCRHTEDRRDLAQEICTQVWKAFPAWDEARPFSTWMYRIALNVAITFVRGGSRQAPIPLDEVEGEPGHDTETERENDDGVRALYRFIDRLDPLNRALVLLYLDEKSLRETAEILGISESNVATKIGRLKQRLREDIAPTGY